MFIRSSHHLLWFAKGVTPKPDLCTHKNNKLSSQQQIRKLNHSSEHLLFIYSDVQLFFILIVKVCYNSYFWCQAIHKELFVCCASTYSTELLLFKYCFTHCSYQYFSPVTNDQKSITEHQNWQNPNKRSQPTYLPTKKISCTMSKQCFTESLTNKMYRLLCSIGSCTNTQRFPRNHIILDIDFIIQGSYDRWNILDFKVYLWKYINYMKIRMIQFFRKNVLKLKIKINWNIAFIYLSGCHPCLMFSKMFLEICLGSHQFPISCCIFTWSCPMYNP